jgi:hypothetical protein
MRIGADGRVGGSGASWEAASSATACARPERACPSGYGRVALDVEGWPKLLPQTLLHIRRLAMTGPPIYWPFKKQSFLLSTSAGRAFTRAAKYLYSTVPSSPPNLIFTCRDHSYAAALIPL